MHKLISVCKETNSISSSPKRSSWWNSFKQAL